MAAPRSILLLSTVAALSAAQASTDRHPARAESCAAVARPGQALAHPIVTGSAGPFERATVILERPAADPQTPFSGRLVTPAGCIALPGPDEPASFFLFDVRAVIFTPLDRSPPRGVVILANRSQIGPGHGTDHIALVYRVTAGGATRVPAIEARLEGLRDAAAVRRALKAR